MHLPPLPRDLRARTLVLVLAACVTAQATAGGFGPKARYEPWERPVPEFDYDDSGDVPWIEEQIEIPPPPEPEQLVALDLKLMPPGLALLADAARISFSPDDRVLRLWLWVRNARGAETGSFEGFRCDTGEYKVYAFANPNRAQPVSRSNRPPWRESGPRRAGNYRTELLQDYFCDFRGPRAVKEIREALHGREAGLSYFE